MHRVVLDTVVFVRALINPKSRSGLLLSEYADRFSLVVSKATAQELLEVTGRPELRRKYKSLGKISSREIIDLLANAEAVNIGTPPAVVRDPKDDISVATARAGKADYIVSEDRDLLALRETLGFSVVDVRTFVEILTQEDN